MGNPVARINDTSSHGGLIITSAQNTICEGKLVATVTDILNCPIHGPNPIVTGSPQFITEGQKVARTTSLTQCGAIIIGGATNTVCE
jgi:uncharacterized Zn-binding protein involved in type VI secretion